MENEKLEFVQTSQELRAGFLKNVLNNNTNNNSD